MNLHAWDGPLFDLLVDVGGLETGQGTAIQVKDERWEVKGHLFICMRWNW